MMGHPMRGAPRKLRHSIFFTKDGDLDFGWLLLLLGFLNGVAVFDLSALGITHVTVAAWAWYGSVISMCFIAGAAIGRARLIAGSKVPGEVAQGIATAGREYGVSTEPFDDALPTNH